MLRIVAVPVRGLKYLVGNTTAHLIVEIPTGVGTPFATIADVRAYMDSKLRGLSVYWRAEAVDADGDGDGDGAIVWLGTRDGDQGPGQTWSWEPAS